MCELLIRARHTLTGKTEKDKGVWRRGDIIRVESDGYKWGNKERKANWIAAGNTAASWHKNTFLVKVPGVPKKKLALFLLHDETISTIPGPLGLEEVRTLLRRRIRHLAVDATPSQIRTKIDSDYEITVTPLQIKNFLRDKDTDTAMELGI